MKIEGERPDVIMNRYPLSMQLRRRSEGQECQQSDDYQDELNIAARAGIQLLEDNSQLHEEVKNLKEKANSMDGEIQTLTKLLEEKHKTIGKLEQHLKASTMENQQLLRENKLLKEKWADTASQLQQHQAETSKVSYRKTTMEAVPDYEFKIEPQVTVMKESKIKSARSSQSLVSLKVSDSSIQMELEKERNRNAALVRDLSSAQKKTRQIKPLQLELYQVSQRATLLSNEAEQQRIQIMELQKERKEERKLMDTLRHALHTYQIGPELGLLKRPKSSKAKSVTYARAGAIEAHEMSVAELTSASNQKQHRGQKDTARELEVRSPEMQECETSMGELNCDAQNLEEQIITLQSMLKHLQIEPQSARDSQSASKKTIVDMQAQLDTAKENTPIQLYETENWSEQTCEGDLYPNKSNANSVSDTTLTEALRFLMDSWSTDRSQRMCLHDWLVSGLRQSGLRKPLFLHQVSDEIAAGFQTLFVPVLREFFGLDIQLRKRRRYIFVTDLSLQYRDPSVESKVQLHRIHRLLYSLNDFETKLQHHERRKAI